MNPSAHNKWFQVTPSAHLNQALGATKHQNMSEIDKEIILILKDLFQNKKNEYIDPDDYLRKQIVKWSIYLAMFSLLAFMPMKLLDKSVPAGMNSFISLNFAVAFTLLFIHINNKSQNPSLIMYGLTWLSLMISLYFTS